MFYIEIEPQKKIGSWISTAEQKMFISNSTRKFLVKGNERILHLIKNLANFKASSKSFFLSFDIWFWVSAQHSSSEIQATLLLVTGILEAKKLRNSSWIAYISGKDLLQNFPTAAKLQFSH